MAQTKNFEANESCAYSIYRRVEHVIHSNFYAPTQ